MSEKRCICNMSQMKWGSFVEPGPFVVREHYANAAGLQTGTLFNCDFSLEFLDRFVTWPESLATAASILPNALGAEVFLIVEKGTLRPMALELIGGDAFPVSRYAELIGGVEAAVSLSIESTLGQQDVCLIRELRQVVPMDKAAFARLFVVGTDATFLYFPREPGPVMRGHRLALTRQEDREIDCYVDGEEVVCLDGWVRMEVVTTEHTLVAGIAIGGDRIGGQHT